MSVSRSQTSPAGPALAVSAAGLTKRFVHRTLLRRSEPQVVTALDRVTFSVERREIFGILGANGSGKSTLVRVLSTLLIPDQGTARVFGYDVVREAGEVKRLINRVSVEASFFKRLSAMENLLDASRLYGRHGRGLRAVQDVGAPVAALWPMLWPSLLIGLLTIPAGVLVFSAVERYAKRTGRLKRSG